MNDDDDDDFESDNAVDDNNLNYNEAENVIFNMTKMNLCTSCKLLIYTTP